MLNTTPANDWREESEIAVFWDEMASFLPKSIERSALGDEKICNAFRAMYPKMKAHLLNLHSAHLVERISELKVKHLIDENGKEYCDLPHEYCDTCEHNQALDQAIDIVKNNK